MVFSVRILVSELGKINPSRFLLFQLSGLVECAKASSPSDHGMSRVWQDERRNGESGWWAMGPRGELVIRENEPYR